MKGHKFTKGQSVTVKSGRVYKILEIREDDHRRFKGEPGYLINQIKNGQLYGPLRISRESNLKEHNNPR